MNIKICIWSGPVAYLLFVLSGVAGGNFSPMSPELSAAQVVAYYQAHLLGIRVAAVLFLISPAFFIAFSAAIMAEMQRMEGPAAPLAWTQLVLGVFLVMPFLPVAIFWTAASFRLDRPPEITQALNDLAWLFDVMPGAPAAFQQLVIGVAILLDRNVVRVFPRWLAYFNFGVGIIFAGGLFCAFTKTGVFAWNGLVPYFLPSYAFTAWVPVMTWMLWRNDRRRASLEVGG